MDLQELRKEIDAVDEALLPLLLRRFAIARQAADYKAAHALPVYDAGREQEIINKIAAKSGEEAAYVKAVYAAVLNASRALQQDEMKTD